MAVCIVAVAFTADLAELVLEWLGIGLAVNIVTTPAYALIFWIWYKLLDIPFIASPKKFFTLTVTCLAELVPGLDAMGGFLWTAGAIIMVIMVRAEDKGGMIGNLSGASMGLMAARYKTYKGDFNRMTAGGMGTKQARVLKSNMAISKGELATAAAKRNPRFSQEQYERGADMAFGLINEKLGPQTRREFLGLERKSPPNTLNLRNQNA